jgi:hypothetical protein
MYKYKLLSILLIASLCGCNLLGNQQPQQSLPVNGGLNTAADLQKALTGAYSDLQTFRENGDSQASDGMLIFGNEFLGDNAVFSGSFPTFAAIYTQTMSATNASITEMWNGEYEDINDCNIILAKLDALKDTTATQATKDNIRGQALFIRALQYFYLVNYFALPSGVKSNDSQMGVPLQIKPVTSSDNFRKPGRSSVDSVYIQITSDLNKAIDLLSSKNGPFRATPAAAYGLLSRIALIRHNYTDAAAYADTVINTGKFELLPDVTTYFTQEGSQESIFAIKNTPQTIYDAVNTSITALHNIKGKDAIQVSGSFKKAINSELNSRQKANLQADGAIAIDTRKTELIVGLDKNGNIIPGNPNNNGGSNSNKYEDFVNNSDNMPVLRYPGILLNRAEALARTQGINSESIHWLNKIRERAFRVKGGPISLIDYKASDFSTKQDLIDAILHERRIELAFEGQRTTTLQRTKQDVRGLPYDSPKLIFPIPQQQIDANGNIKQNPGYGD